MSFSPMRQSGRFNVNIPANPLLSTPKSVTAEELFAKLEETLTDNINDMYFSEPREFRPLIEVLTVLNEKAEEMVTKGKGGEQSNVLTFSSLKDQNEAYSRLLKQQEVVRDVINKVVQFRHGGLNNSVDTMSDVLKEYDKGRDDIRNLCKSLHETQSVLTARKTGQTALKDLWLKKVELENRLRMVREIEKLKNTPHTVQRMMQQKRYLTAVLNLNRAISNMFNEDLVTVVGLNDIREVLMNLKETLLETCVEELREIIIGSVTDLESKETISDTDSETGDNMSDNRSESGRSVVRSQADDRSVVSGSVIETNRSYSSAGIASLYPHSHPHSMSNSHIHPSGNGHGAGKGGSEHYSFELKDLDEAVESSLVDPSTSGSLFTRLLVKTVGVLSCEGDVERMLLETVAKSFKYSIILKLREFAVSKLDRAVMNEESNPGRNGSDPLSLHSKLFSEYVGSLLDSSLSTFNRLMYILKLLKISKYNAGESHPDPARAIPSVDNSAKKSHGRFIIALWDSIEDMIINEIKVHLVEPDVEDITDHAKRSPVRDGGSSKSSKGFAASSRDEFDQQDEDGFQFERPKLIFKPTAKHGAAVYKRVLFYSHAVEKILRENDLLVSKRADNVGGMNSAALLSKAANAKTANNLTVMETLALQNIHNSGKPVNYTNKVLSMMEHFLEEELIPVIQSTVNNVMRDIQLNSSYFTVPKELMKAGIHSLDPANTMAGQQLSREGGNIVICHAAQFCMNSLQPLFSYWLQLNQKQHRIMLSTVLERTIRGYAAAAREELDAIAYNMMSASSAHQSQRGSMKLDIKNTLIEGSKIDPLFHSYRQKVYAGKTSVDELIVGSGGGPSTSSGGESVRRNSKIMTMRVSLDESNSSVYNNALEISAWASLWDMANVQYPVTDSYSEKILTDYNGIVTFASIISGCDWLVRRLCSSCNMNTRKVTSSMGSNSNSTGSARDSVKFKADRHEVAEARAALIASIMNGSRELSRLSEEAMAIIRGEVQIACFYYLQKLANFKFQPKSKAKSASSASSTVQSGGSNPPTRTLAPSDPKKGDQSARKQEDSSSSANEEETIINAMMQHLYQVLDCVGPSQIAAVVVSPLCTVVPKILQKCVFHIFAIAGSPSGNPFSPTANSNSNISGADSVTIENQLLKTRVLRIVVSVQQSIGTMIQDCPHIAVEAKRRLLDILTDEFEKLRRFVTLFNMPVPELEAFLRNNFSDYSKEEIKLLWARASARANDAILSSHSFDDIWRELETKKSSSINTRLNKS